MVAGLVVSGDAVNCFSEFLARRRTIRISLLPEGLSGGQVRVSRSPSLAGNPLPPLSDAWFLFQVREGGIWAVVRIKCGNARWVLVREGLVSEVLLESGVGSVSPSWETPTCVFLFVILLMLVIYLLCYFLNPSNLNN